MADSSAIVKISFGAKSTKMVNQAMIQHFATRTYLTEKALQAQMKIVQSPKEKESLELTAMKDLKAEYLDYVQKSVSCCLHISYYGRKINNLAPQCT